uniref:Uncharacterized protein n=1 Tax=Rhizophora mucronata TaxID=61149 RepID=A0A2P2MJT4_RHIMU
MGACATKPKVAKEEAQAPEPPPEPAKEETAAPDEVKKEVGEAVAAAVGGEEEKKVVEKVIGEGDQPGGGGDKLKEVVDADKPADDDHSSKRRSLNNLFQEKDGQNQLIEGDRAPTETLKSETENPIQQLTQEPSVTAVPTGPAEPLKLEKSGTEKFVEAAEVLPAEDKIDSPVAPPPGRAAVDATVKVEAEK